MDVDSNYKYRELGEGFVCKFPRLFVPVAW